MSGHTTACLIIIGNEILSGRTKDKNLAHLGEELNKMGIRLMEGRVIPDVAETIVATLNECRAKFTYVFTTGGIGPTHDDITTVCVAQAFGVKVIRHPEAERRLLAHYKPEDVNEARMKMADVPDGATLIDNPVSAAPGYRIGNVFVMAGVPRIMHAMLDFCKNQLEGGEPVKSNVLDVEMAEGNIADKLGFIQEKFSDVEIGIYPKIRNGKLASTIVLRCADARMLMDATDATEAMLSDLGAEISDRELEAEAR
ncbi:MAG: competence/damage-inducible protein A [Rickettsiales bacterium]|nr:competence/damage-inducible protein A [Rickettsiales bacterium]